MLRHPSASRELLYKFAPALVAAAPAEAVDFFVSAVSLRVLLLGCLNEEPCVPMDVQCILQAGSGLILLHQHSCITS